MSKREYKKIDDSGQRVCSFLGQGRKAEPKRDIMEKMQSGPTFHHQIFYNRPRQYLNSLENPTCSKCQEEKEGPI
jgi:hypothetical protein